MNCGIRHMAEKNIHLFFFFVYDVHQILHWDLKSPSAFIVARKVSVWIGVKRCSCIFGGLFLLIRIAYVCAVLRFLVVKLIILCCVLVSPTFNVNILLLCYLHFHINIFRGLRKYR